MDSAQPFAAGQDATGLGAGILDAHAALLRLDEWIDDNCGSPKARRPVELEEIRP